MRDYIVAELNRKTEVEENGKTKTVTNREALAKLYVDDAFNGDHRAKKDLLTIDQDQDGPPQGGGVTFIIEE